MISAPYITNLYAFTSQKVKAHWNYEYITAKAKLEAMNGGSENNGGSEGGENPDEGGCGSAASASGIMALLVAGVFCTFITKRH